MMGTLASAMARKDIPTPEARYHADVEGDIENVNGVLKITQIRVVYHLTVQKDKVPAARDIFSSYLERCPAAQSVIGCIDISDRLVLDEIT
jgi:hypothetical protein